MLVTISHRSSAMAKNQLSEFPLDLHCHAHNMNTSAMQCNSGQNQKSMASRSENASTGHEQMHVCMHARTDGWIKNIMSTAAHRAGSGSMKNKHNQWLSAYLGW